ncbi:MAG: hypothetical protein LUH21_04585 [Clostridiales bacterium]|nr:hypothetical protein [Clostridiales bacterium]
MIKTTITETTEKFDENGKLIEKITRIEESNDDTVYPNLNMLSSSTSPSVPNWWEKSMCNIRSE